MSVEKRNKGYCVRWRDSSGTARSKQVALWRDAVVLDGEMKRKKAMGELIVHERGTIRLTDFWDVWWTNYALVHLSERSRDNYDQLWRTHIKPALGRHQLRVISREQVSTFVAKLSTKLAPSSVRNVIAVLQSVLTTAVEWSYIGASPAARIKKPKLAGAQRRGWALDDEQLAALFAELPDLRSRCIAQLLAYTGLRPGELRGLNWDHLQGQSLIVECAASSDRIGPTKTGAVRSVPLCDEAWKILLEWKLKGGSRAHQLMFPSPARGGIWTDQGYRMWQRQVFTLAAKRAGLEGLRPYDLRHTYITDLVRSGLDPIEVAGRAGHSLEMTVRVYSHEFKSVYAERTAQPSNLRIVKPAGGFEPPTA